MAINRRTPNAGAPAQVALHFRGVLRNFFREFHPNFVVLRWRSAVAWAFTQPPPPVLRILSPPTLPRGFATEFRNRARFTNVAAVLGEPARLNPGPFGGPTDPFNPPFLRDQLLSIGAAGSLTVRFDRPILNSPGNPFGLDFIIFGNSGFIITNGNFTGGGITDGLLFGANSGQTRVSVSADNVTYFPLSPSLAPTVDGYFPVDGAGDFLRPVNPDFRGSDFSAAIWPASDHTLRGSGGGTGFDISWAQDVSGRNADLASVVSSGSMCSEDLPRSTRSRLRSPNQERGCSARWGSAKLLAKFHGKSRKTDY